MRSPNTILKLAESKTIVCDTCSLVNLLNGKKLAFVLNIPGTIFLIGPLVYREVCKVEGQKKIIDDLLACGKLKMWVEEINIELLSKLYSLYSLGDGETECIAICIENNVEMCSDDRKARMAGENELMKEKVMGSLRLLKMAVGADLIKCSDAKIAYHEMRAKGGFLPKNVENAYFCKAS
jgi:predicted nucleic acid-binding protein